MAGIGRSTVSLAAVGVLALAALAAFLVLDLAGGSVDPSSLPVIQIGQGGATTTAAPGPTTPASGQGQVDGTSPTARSAPGSSTTQDTQASGGGTTVSTGGTTTGSTVREVVGGGVHTGAGGGTGGSAATGGSGGTASTNTTGGR